MHGRGSLALEPCRFDIYVPHYRTCLKSGTLYIKIGNTNRVVEIKQISTPKLAQTQVFHFPILLYPLFIVSAVYVAFMRLRVRFSGSALYHKLNFDKTALPRGVSNISKLTPPKAYNNQNLITQSLNSKFPKRNNFSSFGAHIIKCLTKKGWRGVNNTSLFHLISF